MRRILCSSAPGGVCMAIDLRVLGLVPLFAGLCEEDLAHVAAVTLERHYDRGDIILLEAALATACAWCARDW
jgi:hypothetical protein